MTPQDTQETMIGKTWLDIFRIYKPDITEDEANYLLWNNTCYPFDADTTIKQIAALFK